MKTESVLARIAMSCAVLCGLVAETYARDRRLRTGPADSYVVFGNRDQEPEVWVARGRAAPVAVALPKTSWILDALIDDAQQLWVAHGDPREGPVQIWRFDNQKSVQGNSTIGSTNKSQTNQAAHKTSVSGTSAIAEVQLLTSGDSVYLATPEGLWGVSRGSPQKLAAWRTESYGFYGASVVRAGSSWLLLVPGFNTCGSSDLLESLDLFEQGPAAKVERRTIPLPQAPFSRAWLGADGWRYSTGCEGDVGVIGRHGAGRSWPVVHREPAPSCSHHLEQNGRFTIVSFGKVLLRVHEGHTERLGTTDTAADGPESFHPDRQGRAVALLRDGTVVRYSSRQPPERIGRVAASVP